MKLSNPQWHLLDQVPDGGVYIMKDPPTMVEKSLRAKGALVHMHGNRYMVSPEAKEAVDNVNRLSEKYDRGFRDGYS